MKSLEIRIRNVWMLYWLIASAVAGVVAYFLDSIVLELGLESMYLGAIAFLVFIALGVAHSIYRYRIWGYEVREDSLYLKKGVFTRVRTIVPYARVQHVDTQRSVLERILNLSTLVVYTAGSRGSDVKIPGLKPGVAEKLQDELKDRATEFELGREDAV